MSLSIRNIASSLFSAQRSTVLVRGQVDLLAQSMGRLNASLRVSQQRDAVSSIVLSASLTAIVRGYQAGLRNTEQGRSMVDISRDALTAQTSLVQQLQGIALQSASNDVSDNDRAELDRQAQSLVAEVGRIAHSANFKQLPLLDGTLGTVLLQVGPSPQETVPLRFDRTATSLALGLLGGNLGPPTYSQIGAGVSGSFVGGDLKINGSIAGTLDDAANIAQAINALSSQYGASASNEVSGLNFQTLQGPAPTPAVATVANQNGAFVEALSDGQTAIATQSVQNGTFVAAVSDGVTGVATQAVQSGAYIDAVSDGVAVVATQAAQSGAFVDAVSDGVAVVATHADQSGAFVDAVSDGVAVVATQAAQTGAYVDAVSDGVAVVATHADQSGVFVDAVSDGVAVVATQAAQTGAYVDAVSDGVAVVATQAAQTGAYVDAVSDGVAVVATHADQSGTFVAAVSDGVAVVATHADQSGAYVTAVSDGATAVATHADQSGAYVTAVSDGAVAVATRAALSAAWTSPVSDTSTRTAASGAFATVTPPGTGEWQFQFTVGSVSVIDPTSSVVTAADIDAALAAKASDLQTLDGITYTGSAVAGDLVFIDAQGDSIHIVAVTSDDPTVHPPGVSNPTMGFEQSAFNAPGDFNENLWGNDITGTSSPFTVTVDGATVFSKAGGNGVSVSSAELDAAFAAFASASSGAYGFSGSFSDASAELTKADGTAIDIELASNFDGQPGALPGMTGVTNNGSQAVGTTSPFELTVDGTSVFQKAAAVGATVTAAELDTALSNFAAGSNGAYSYSGSLANGDASLSKADGSALDVQISSNFAGTAGALPGLSGTTNNGTLAVGSSSAFELKVDGASVFQKAAAVGATVTAAELDTALSDFAANSSGAYIYSGSLANGDASLSKADGSAIDVDLSSNFAGTAGALPGLTGITNNGTQAVAATTAFELKVDGTSVFQKAAAPGATVTAAELDTALSDFAANSNGAYAYSGSLANGNASLSKADGSAVDVELSSNFAGTAGDLPGLAGITNNGTQAVAPTTPFELKVDGTSVFQKAAAPGVTVTAAELDTALSDFATNSNGAYSYTGSLANGDANLSKADGSALDIELSSNFAGTAGDLPGLAGITNNGTQAVAPTTPFELQVDGATVFQKVAAPGVTVTAAELDTALSDFAANSNGAYSYSGSLANGDANLTKADGSALDVQLSSNFAGTAGDLPGLTGITNNGTQAVAPTTPFELQIDGVTVFQKAAAPGVTVTAAELDTALADFAANSGGVYGYSGSLANGDASLSKADGSAIDVQLSSNFAGTAGDLPGMLGTTNNGTQAVAATTPFELQVDGVMVFQKAAAPGVTVTAAELDTALADFAANSNGAYSYSGSLAAGDANLTKADGSELDVQLSSNFAGTAGDLPGLTGITNNGTEAVAATTPFELQVDGVTVFQKAAAPGETVTAAELDTALADFATNSNGAYIYTGSLANGDANLSKADGSALDIELSSNFAGTAGDLPGMLGIANNGTEAVAATTPFELQVDGVTVFQKAAAPGETVTAAELDTALADFATNSGGAYAYSGSLANGDASLVKTDGSAIDVQLSSNFAGTAGDLPGLVGLTNNGTEAVAATTPFELQIDGVTVFQKAAAPSETVTAAELDTALADFATNSNGAYIYTGSLANGDANLTKADGSVMDVELSSNFAGTAGDLPGLLGIANNGTEAVAATTPFELHVDGVTVFQKAAAPGETVTAAELDSALTDFAANSSGAYSYSGSLANGDASLVKADGSAIDVQLSSNFAGTAGDLPGLVGLINNGTEAVAATTPFQLKVDGVSVFQKAAAPGATVTAAELDTALLVFAVHSHGAYSYTGSLANGDANLSKADGSAIDVDLSSNFAATAGELPGLAGITNNGVQAVAATTPFQLKVDGVSVFQKAAAPGVTVSAAELDTALSDFAASSNGAYSYSGSLANGDANLSKANGSAINVQLSSNFAGTAGDLPGLLGITNNGTPAVIATTPFQLKVDGTWVFQKAAAPGATVTAAELDTALADFASNSNGAYGYSGSLSNGDAVLSRADGRTLNVQLVNNFAGTAGALPGIVGLNTTGTRGIAPSTPFKLKVDGVTVFQKNAGVGVSVTAGELDTALSDFAANSNGAYSYSGSLANGDASLSKANGTPLNVQVTSNFAGTPGALPGLSGTTSNGIGIGPVLAPDYQFSLNGTALDLSAAAADGDITMEEIAAAINGVAGMSAQVVGGKLSLKKADGGNITLAQSGADAATGGFDGGAGSAVYRGSVSIRSNAPITIAGDDPSQAGFQPGALVAQYLAYVGINLRDPASAGIAVRVSEVALELLRNYSTVFSGTSDHLNSVSEFIAGLEGTAERARDRALDRSSAAETAAAARLQILRDAGSALVAQANVSTRTVLSLLKQSTPGIAAPASAAPASTLGFKPAAS